MERKFWLLHNNNVNHSDLTDGIVYNGKAKKNVSGSPLHSYYMQCLNVRISVINGTIYSIIVDLSIWFYTFYSNIYLSTCEITVVGCLVVNLVFLI